MPSARECGCPAWVLRCAHWGDQTLRWDDTHLGMQIAPDHVRHPFQYYVAGPGIAEPCECGGYDMFPSKYAHLLMQTNDFAAAEREFLRREALLLGRDDG